MSHRFDLLTLGDLVVDLVVEIDHFPVLPGQHQPSQDHVLEVGGAGNLLIAAARLGLRSGALARLGDDIYAHFMADVLRAEGVDISAVDLDREKQTVVVVTLVANGDHVFLGGMSGQPEVLIPARWRTAIADSRALYIEGYAFADLSPGMVMDAVGAAQAAGALIFFDPGPDFYITGTDHRGAVLGASTVLMLTAEEAESLTGRSDPEAAAQELRRQGPTWVVVKQGAAGCTVYTAAGIVHGPPFPTRVVDTSGAGDSFNAGIIYGYLHEFSPARSARLANALGAVTVSKLGAGRNVATREEVMGLLGDKVIG